MYETYVDVCVNFPGFSMRKSEKTEILDVFPSQ